METRLVPGAEFEAVTGREFAELLGRHADLQTAREGAGIRIRRFSVPNAKTLTSSQSYVVPWSPEPGYAWALREIAFRTTLQVYVLSIGDLGSTTGQTNLVIATNPVSSSSPAFQFSGTQTVLWPGEYVVISCTGGSFTITNVNMTVAEVPAQDLWKLV